MDSRRRGLRPGRVRRNLHRLRVRHFGIQLGRQVQEGGRHRRPRQGGYLHRRELHWLIHVHAQGGNHIPPQSSRSPAPPPTDNAACECSLNRYYGSCGGLETRKEANWCTEPGWDTSIWEYSEFCCAASSGDCCESDDGAVTGLVIGIFAGITLCCVACCYCCKCCCTPKATTVVHAHPGVVVTPTWSRAAGPTGLHHHRDGVAEVFYHTVHTGPRRRRTDCIDVTTLKAASHCRGVAFV